MLLRDEDYAFEQTQGHKYAYCNRAIGEIGESYDIESGDLVYCPLQEIPWTSATHPLEYGTEEALWNEVKGYLYDHLDLDDLRAYDVLTGAIFMTWRIEDFSFLCYVYFLGPPASGKTRALELVNSICFRPIFAATMSSSALFRSVSTWRPTLILDEVQSYLSEKKEEFLSLICAGQRRGQYAIRVEKIKEDQLRLELHDVFCPKFMASTRETTETIASRSIILNMMKNIRRVPLFVNKEKAGDIRNKFLTYRLRNIGQPLPELADFKEFRDGRVVELFYNLAQLAPTDTVKRNILSYAKEFEDIRLAEERYGWYASVFEAFLRAAKESMETGKVPVEAVTRILNEDKSEKERVRASTVGRLLNVLGLKHATRMPDGKMARLYIKSTVQRLAKRYVPDQLSLYFSEGAEGSEGDEETPSRRTRGSEKNPDFFPSNPSVLSEPSEVMGICDICREFAIVKPTWQGNEKKNVCENCAKNHHIALQQGAYDSRYFTFGRIKPAEPCELCGELSTEWEITDKRDGTLLRRCDRCKRDLERKFGGN